MNLFVSKTYFFILHGGFLQINPFVRSLKASFLVRLKVSLKGKRLKRLKGSLDVCAIFLVS